MVRSRNSRIRSLRHACDAPQEIEKNGYRGAEQDAQADRRQLAKQGLRIARTSTGRGLFATRHFHWSEKIGEITGTVHPYDEHESNYCFDLENGKLLEPDAPFRFVNHSCEPNCRFHLFLDRNPIPNLRSVPKLFLYAAQIIAIGEELTIDYKWHWENAIPCRCGSESCRGWIVDKRFVSLVRE